MNQQFCTFFVGPSCFGVNVTRVQEVIRYQVMTRVPLAGREVSGLINLRGQIVTAIDMRARMNLPPLEGDALPMNVVVRTADGPVSLLVDEIGDVIDVADETFENVPETMSARARELVGGIYKLEGALLLVLDTERAVSVGAPKAERAA
jgi:purine-binding chemotaxis protein CheW